MLINVVLSCLLVYYLSFYKAPLKVIQSITKIPRNFLWGGSESCKKIAWVRWDTVCRSREEGGLGIKNPPKL